MSWLSIVAGVVVIIAAFTPREKWRPDGWWMYRNTEGLEIKTGALWFSRVFMILLGIFAIAHGLGKLRLWGLVVSYAPGLSRVVEQRNRALPH